MCFCYSILIFKIIPIFKIMIVIRFQIWFLIKFKLQRREWVSLKLCFYTRWDSCTINIDLNVCKKGGEENLKKESKKKKYRRELTWRYNQKRKKAEEDERKIKQKKRERSRSKMALSTVGVTFSLRLQQRS